MIDVWKAAGTLTGPTGPDIYVPDVKAVLADYAREDNPLLVPEAQFRTGSLFYAIGHYRAIGFSVFGIEDGRADSQLARAFALLAPMNDLITSAQAQGRIEGILLEDGEPEHSFTLGGYQVTMRGTRELLNEMLLDAGVPTPPPPAPQPSEIDAPDAPPAPADGRPFGLLIAEVEDGFVLVGQGLTVDFSHAVDVVEIDHVEEGRMGLDGWQPGRVLNGDERLYLVPIDHLGVVRIRLLRTTA